MKTFWIAAAIGIATACLTMLAIWAGGCFVFWSANPVDLWTPGGRGSALFLVVCLGALAGGWTAAVRNDL